MSAILGLAISCFKTGKTTKDGGFWTYKTNKTITYDVWQLGLTNRVLQAFIAIYVVVYLYLFEAGWAYAERPMGSFNAWSEGGGSCKYNECKEKEEDYDTDEDAVVAANSVGADGAGPPTRTKNRVCIPLTV